MDNFDVNRTALELALKSSPIIGSGPAATAEILDRASAFAKFINKGELPPKDVEGDTDAAP
jgi:hypothetical protein